MPFWRCPKTQRTNPFSQRQVEIFRKKFTSQKEQLLQEEEREMPIDNHGFEKQGQYLATYLTEYYEQWKVENPTSYAQAVKSTSQREGNDRFVIENAERLNRKDKGQPSTMEIRNGGKNFYPNAFPVDQMNVKNVLDTCLHNNCSRYHTKTRGQTNTPQLSVSFLMGEEQVGFQTGPEARLADVFGPWQAIPDTGAACSLLPYSWYEKMRARIPEHNVVRAPEDLVGLGQQPLPVYGCVILWTKIGQQTYPLRFIIMKNIHECLLSFRALVLFSYIPVNFGE